MAREVQASEAKTHFARLSMRWSAARRSLSRGTDRPSPGPEASQRQREIDEALADIEELRKHTGKVAIEEILALRHEGHKY
jgi:hypothetical protein